MTRTSTGAGDVAARFDRVSAVYDETREPLTTEEVERLADLLRKHGVQSILEVGVGTGRIALPLQERGFEVYGVDLSNGMLQKAKAKGMKNILLGDANQLPFGDKSFDAVVLAHVIHLLDDPSKTFDRLSRASRRYVVAIVRKRDWSVPPSEEGRNRLWELFRQAAEEEGYHRDAPARDWRQRFLKEEEFIASSHPDELQTIGDTQVVTTLGERFTLIEKRAYGYPNDIPEDVFRRIMERVKSCIDLDREIRYRRVEQVAFWRVGRTR